jgi:hypothetical protein
MRKYFERASSVERRFISVTLLVLFLALNWIFVWPLFSDWSKLELRRDKAQRTLKLFQDTVAQAGTLSNKVATLEGEAMGVPPEDQTVTFMTTIQSQAAASQVNILTSVAQSPRTNQFFLERAQGLTLTADEKQLVDFLYKLGTGDSLVRVRGLSLHPDPPRHALAANLTLVANYKKKITARAATPATASAPVPVAKPAPAKVAPADKPTPVPVKPGPAGADKSKSTAPAKADKPTGPAAIKPSTPIKK